MIAYPKELIETLKIKVVIVDWKNKNFINEDTTLKIEKEYKEGLYTATLFIRIGLFIFTTVLAFAAIGLLTLMSMDGSSDTSVGIRLLIYSFLILGALELFIKNKLPYRAGIDDALLYIAIGFFISAIMVFFSHTENLSEKAELLLSLLFIFPVCIIAAIRYLDRLATASAFVCLVFILFVSLNMMGLSALLPFTGMTIATILYLLNKKFQKVNYLIWWDNLIIVEILSLFLFYFSGNYFVVRELSISLLSIKLQEGQDIPLAFLFYAFTIIVPFLYLYKSIITKDRVMLRVGLIIVALAVLTFKYYFSLGHHEITLTIAGIILIMIGWYVERLLRSPKIGLTSLEDEKQSNTNIEAMIISQTFSKTGTGSDKGNFEFGGGETGGGGASGKY
jgi:hypothetical protein